MLTKHIPIKRIDPKITLLRFDGFGISINKFYFKGAFKYEIEGLPRHIYGIPSGLKDKGNFGRYDHLFHVLSDFELKGEYYEYFESS